MTDQLTREQIRNRRRWAQALESSVKAKARLVAGARGECCLGVACRVLAGKTRAEMRGYSTPAAVGVDLHELVGLHSNLGAAVLGIYSYVVTETDLAAHNDGATSMVEEWSHPEIALYLYLTAEAGIP